MRLALASGWLLTLQFHVEMVNTSYADKELKCMRFDSLSLGFLLVHFPFNSEVCLLRIEAQVRSAVWDKKP